MKNEKRGKPHIRYTAMQIVNSALLGKRVVAGGNAADIDNGHRLRKLGGRYAAVLQQRRQKKVVRRRQPWHQRIRPEFAMQASGVKDRSEEHTSELQSLMRNSYADFCLKNKNN